jgi:hypothetical protein
MRLTAGPVGDKVPAGKKVAFKFPIPAINEVLARGWTNEGVAFCAPQ